MKKFKWKNRFEINLQNTSNHFLKEQKLLINLKMKKLHR